MCEQGIKVVGAGAPASQVQDKPPDRREKIARRISALSDSQLNEFILLVASQRHREASQCDQDLARRDQKSTEPI